VRKLVGRFVSRGDKTVIKIKSANRRVQARRVAVSSGAPTSSSSPVSLDTLPIVPDPPWEIPSRYSKVLAPSGACSHPAFRHESKTLRPPDASVVRRSVPVNGETGRRDNPRARDARQARARESKVGASASESEVWRGALRFADHEFVELFVPRVCSRLRPLRGGRTTLLCVYSKAEY
jgi:hypothetical protein